MLAACVLYTSAIGQDNDHIKDPALGFYFLLNDFKTATAIRSSSLASVLREKTFGNISGMNPGIGINYMHGLSNRMDFSASLGGSFINYPFEGRGAAGSESLLLEGDISLLARLLPDKYWVSPFLSAGLGASKYKVYYGAFIPVGGGLQVSFYKEAFVFFNSQYRLRITEHTSYHFFYSVGVNGTIGSRKQGPAN